MNFDPPLQPATLIRRYKRFLADIELPSGELTTIHCANTGSMKNCIVENSPCWYSTSSNPKRKYPFTWELATTPDGHIAGINTSRANYLVLEGIESGVIRELQGYAQCRSEVRYGKENSRIDFLLSDESIDDITTRKPICYVEVKNVTLGMGNGLGQFPDSVSQRASKHLRELIGMVRDTHRAVLVFCVQHSGIERVSPAEEIDPEYAAMLRKAVDEGVEVLAYGASMNQHEIVLNRKLTIEL